MTLRDIPAVHELLARPAMAVLCAESGTEYVTVHVREVLAEIREELRAGVQVGDRQVGDIETRIFAAVRDALAPSLKPVINATGVVLHTNLGRAPMSAAAARAVAEAASSYTNLEYDLGTGKRGKRDAHASAFLERLLGVPAVVVNNNAAAVFLVLHELAGGDASGEAIVSRGELVEIGGSFRVPDIMARSGAILKEVGTTNRTRIADYAQAASAATRLLLRVHPSNFRMIGFTERPSLDELSGLARSLNIPLVEDIGSGCLFPIGDEPMVADSLRAGVDLIAFSCDKLMGGPQAGIIAGRADLVARVRRNPLFRVLRADKLTYAALGATLRSWVTGQSGDLPVVRMIQMPAEEIRGRAERFAAAVSAMGWRAGLQAGESIAGGGSTPGQTLPTTLVAIEGPRIAAPGIAAPGLQSRLRAGNPPVIARVEEDRLLIDLRTVFPEQEATLLGALQRAGAGAA